MREGFRYILEGKFGIILRRIFDERLVFCYDGFCLISDLDLLVGVLRSRGYWFYFRDGEIEVLRDKVR